MVFSYRKSIVMTEGVSPYVEMALRWLIYFLQMLTCFFVELHNKNVPQS